MNCYCNHRTSRQVVGKKAIFLMYRTKDYKGKGGTIFSLGKTGGIAGFLPSSTGVNELISIDKPFKKFLWK